MLRALGTEEGPRVRDFRGQRSAVESVFDDGPNGPCGALWPQGETASPAVGEGEHLLAHYVSALPHTAHVQRRVLKDR